MRKMTTMERPPVYGTAQRSTTISTSMEKETTVADLTWVDTTHKISEIVSRSPPLLPIMIKCAALSSDPYIAAKIQPGDIMKLSRLQSIDVVEATVEFKSTAAQHLKDFDEYNGVHLPSFLAIPKSMESLTFEVVRGSVRYSTTLGLQDGMAFGSKSSTLKANQPSVRFKTVMALSRQLPRFVKVIKTSRQIRQNTKIVEGHVLEIMGLHTPWATRDKFLSCRIDEPDGQVCKLDLKWKGTFDTVPDTKRYNIQDLLRVYRFPITVRVRDFSPTEWIPQKTCSQLKAIKTLDLNLTIEKEETIEFAMAISQTQASSSLSSLGACHDPQDFRLMILSKNIDVDFVTSSDMTMNPKGYAEVMNRIGSIGDSMVSMVSKDIYLNEYGSPMVVEVPFSKLQPRQYGIPVRGEVMDHDAMSELMHIDEDPYESLSAIQKNAEKQRCENLLRAHQLEEYNQSQEDEVGTDYTILRSPSTILPSPIMPNTWRRHLSIADSTSHYQVPKIHAEDDIYITEDRAGNPYEHDDDEELDVPGTAGQFEGRIPLRSRCPDSLPRDFPPPVPNRLPHLRRLSHKTLDRTESTPAVHKAGLLKNSSHTLDPSMKIASVDVATSSPFGLQPRNRPTVASRCIFSDGTMSALMLEMRNRQRESATESVDEESESDAKNPEIRVDPSDDTPPPLPPPRDRIVSRYNTSVPLPPTPPVGSPELPSPPPERDMQNLPDLPIADFPPPLPGRSSSLASLSSLASMTSVASAASAASAGSAASAASTSSASPPASMSTAISMKSATSITSIDSLQSFTSCVSMPESHHSFQDALKTVKTNTGNRFPTLPSKGFEARERLHQESRSAKINRSQSCSPSRLRNRNISAARRELPPLPIPEQQREVPPITEFATSEQQPNVRRPRPSSSGNILEDGREPLPLPNDRASSMENLLCHDEDDRRSRRPPPPPPARSSSTKKPRPQGGRRSFFRPNQSKTQNVKDQSKTRNVQIPIANIAPRPSPRPSPRSSQRPSQLESMLRSLAKPRDGLPPTPRDTSHAAQHTTSPEDDDDDDDDDFHDYLHPEELEPTTYDDARSSGKFPQLSKKSNSLPRGGILSIKDIPIDIAPLSCDHIAQALALLNIRDDIIENLRSVQMNGELLKSMTEDILQKEFHMSQFYAIKVIKFVNGWRP